MPAYLVVDLDIRDHDVIADYRSKALPLVAKAGGHLIALDDAALGLEGQQATNMPIIEFPDKADAIADAIAHVIGQPADVDTSEIVIRPTAST